jgi:anthranilate phosphoribosyltransferase
MVAQVKTVHNMEWRARPSAFVTRAESQELDMIKDILGRVSGGEDLSMELMADTIGSIMEGHWQEEEIALLLTGLRIKGETVAEIAGAALAMRRHMRRVETSRDRLLDTCGTGGDGSETFNISTAAAIVAAAAGVAVAKHGNRGISSKSGSADVLAALGVNIEASIAQCEACLNQVGICFCFAPLMHQSMKHVAPVRKKLGVPTIFNMLGPLCNPARAQFQLLGVGKPHLRNTLAQALRLLGTERAVVVCGQDGLDEVSLQATTDCTWTDADGWREFQWTPEQFGLRTQPGMSAMKVANPQESAAVITAILAGAPGPPREIVVLNAAAAIWTIDPTLSEVECSERARQAIDTGAARHVLNELRRVSRE